MYMYLRATLSSVVNVVNSIVTMVTYEREYVNTWSEAVIMIVMVGACVLISESEASFGSITD